VVFVFENYVLRFGFREGEVQLFHSLFQRQEILAISYATIVKVRPTILPFLVVAASSSCKRFSKSLLPEGDGDGAVWRLER